MNKIINISLCNIVFQIEDNAYELLKNYLISVKKNLGNQASSLEIYQDVESRIAELFNLKIQAGKNIITPEIVNEVTTQIGDATQFAESTEAGNNQSNEQNTFEFPTPKTLHRNIDDKVVGGVCSGLAAYFDLDTTLVRLLWALAIFVGGFGFLIYIILWIVLKPAFTPAQKAAMYGNNVKKNFNYQSGNVNSAYNYTSNSNSGVQLLNGAMKLLALGFLGLALLILIPICFAVLVGATSIGFGGATLFGLLFENPNVTPFLMISVVIIFVLPVIALIYKIALLIFKFNPIQNWIKSLLSVIWVIALLMIVLTGIYLKNEFRSKETQSMASNFTLIPNKVITISSDNNGTIHFKKDKHKKNGWISQINFNGVSIDNVEELRDSLLSKHVEINLEPSTSNNPNINITKKAYGQNTKSAVSRLNKIFYKYAITDSTIFLPSNFEGLTHEQWRNQSIEATIQLPVGTQIKFTNGMANNLDNSDDIYDENKLFDDVIYEMTIQGLKEKK